jgi:hypothetical protein
VVCGRILAVALVAAGLNKEPRMAQNDYNKDRIESFKKRVGFSKLVGVDGPDGVVANWAEMPNTLIYAKGKRIDSGQVYLLEPGLAKAKYVWKQGEDYLSVWVFVSGTGPSRAQERLLSLSSETMMPKIPYESGPAKLGDLSVRSPEPPFDVVMWVYRNVCVYVGTEVSARDVEPVAREIQRFMEAHHVSRLADHLPVVDRVDVSARQIHVGDELKLSIILGKTTPLESVRTHFNEVGEHRLEVLSIQPLTATYRAKTPGQTRIDIPVVDRKTLLSPPLSVTVDILPAR